MDATQLLHMWLSVPAFAAHTHMEMFNRVIKATHMWGMEKCSVFHTQMMELFAHKGRFPHWPRLQHLLCITRALSLTFFLSLSLSLSICASVILSSYLCTLSSSHDQQMKACVLFFLSKSSSLWCTVSQWLFIPISSSFFIASLSHLLFLQWMNIVLEVDVFQSQGFICRGSEFGFFNHFFFLL